MDKTTLNKLIAKFNKSAEGLTDKIVKDFQNYQREYERLLLKTEFDAVNGRLKSTVKNFNKAQSLNPAQKLGFNSLALKSVKNYDDIAKGELALLKEIGVSTSLTFRDLSFVKRLKEIDYSALWLESQMLDNMVKRQLVNGIASGGNYGNLADNIADDLLGAGDTMGNLARYAKTYIRTSAADLARAVDGEVYATMGGDNPKSKWIYAGPVDVKTRPFCKTYAGQTKTRKEWEEIGASEGVDVFMQGAGWNCRHRLLLVEE